MRATVIAAALASALAAPAANAATFTIGFDASQFVFDGFFHDLRTETAVAIGASIPSGLEGLEMEFMINVTTPAPGLDIWAIDNTDANSFMLTGDDGSSLVYTGVFDDLDFADSEPFDTVVMTISGFAPSPSVMASLRAAPRLFFGPASEVPPIPVPLAGPMLVGALGLLGLLRVRRRA